MLNDEICKLRDKLNKSIEDNEDYDEERYDGQEYAHGWRPPYPTECHIDDEGKQKDVKNVRKGYLQKTENSQYHNFSISMQK